LPVGRGQGSRARAPQVRQARGEPGPLPDRSRAGDGRAVGDHADLGRPELDGGHQARREVAVSRPEAKPPEEGGAPLAPPSVSRARPAPLPPAAAVVVLPALGLALQLWFFRHYPQPPLFGDPAGYDNVGLRLREAVQRLGAGESLSSVFASVRGLFYLLG